MITNIAHRGARLLAPENTLEAAQLAHISGASMWELDVQYSADKKLIIIHDDTLERTTNIHLFTEFESRFPWRVCDFTSIELQKLNFGYAFIETPSDIPSKHYNAPFLDNAVILSKKLGIEMNIEIKDINGLSGYETIARHVYDTVKKNLYLPHVLFSSFNIDYLFQIRNIDAHARIAVLMDKPDDDLFQLLNRLNAQAYHPHWKIVNQPIIDRMHQKKIQVNLWTVNNKNDMSRFIKMGVDGIITDDPALLNSIIKSYIE
jgi:glycerophosphoryl diester phosphodiesterase